MTIKEYDLVVLLKPRPEDGLRSGAIGTVLMVYGFPAEAYEVEFVDRNGNTIAVVTVPSNDLSPCDGVDN